MSRTEQLAEVARLYPGDWWTHRNGHRRPVRVVVGTADPGDRDTPPRPATERDPVWRSPDGLAPVLVLHSRSGDCWYRHGNVLIRTIDCEAAS